MTTATLLTFLCTSLLTRHVSYIIRTSIIHDVVMCSTIIIEVTNRPGQNMPAAFLFKFNLPPRPVLPLPLYNHVPSPRSNPLRATVRPCRPSQPYLNEGPRCNIAHARDSTRTYARTAERSLFASATLLLSG
ncbi:hypothetical protein BD626DRAFT_9281 [Schizophyllum amplum]|uniref:Secreted protein n=1 Tax=Schizophyllum amplum TaxID=97359 RepID=A0A550CWX3_9AGAR|nr:hypothetical protein BD626DRAFT_9281 [Auriculariopsis ampla]